MYLNDVSEWQVASRTSNKKNLESTEIRRDDKGRDIYLLLIIPFFESLYCYIF